MHLKKYFIGNWKMNGHLKDLNQIKKVDFFLKNTKKKVNIKCIFCIPTTILSFASKIKFSKLDIGSQNISSASHDFGAYTGEVSSKMIKNLKCNYSIIGHSERRAMGETDKDINIKVKFANQNNLKIILCVGDTYKEFKSKKTFFKVKKQIKSALNKNKKNLNNILIAYEPIWSIGTGKIPAQNFLEDFFSKMKYFLKKEFKINIPILYGGSVSSKNISEFKSLYQCDGFLIGGASLKSKNFIDIIKKYYN